MNRQDNPPRDTATHPLPGDRLQNEFGSCMVFVGGDHTTRCHSEKQWRKSVEMFTKKGAKLIARSEL